VSGSAANPSPGPPRVLFWESTSRCNLACVHCRRNDIQDDVRDELTTDEVRGFLQSAASLGHPLVIFSGGEPLLRDDWDTLALHAKSLGLPTALATNATLLDASLAQRVEAAGFRRVSVSIDGADAGTHDAFRGQQGAFARALEGVEHLRRAGVAVQVNVTVARHNADQLDALYDLALSVGAMALHVFLLVPVGCGASLGSEHRLTPDDCERALTWVCEKQLAGSLELRATCAPQYARIAAQHGIPGARGGCLCGTSVAFINHQGEVYPCGYLPVSCGNLRQTPFETLWRESEVFAALRDRDRLKGACGACDHRTTCGGCRARAYAATGDYLEADPSCMYRRPSASSGDQQDVGDEGAAR
jgi:AdoMet-dependent heme synthase